MKNFTLRLLVVSLLLLTINACNKDEETDPNNTNTSSNLFGSTVSVTVKGKVCDVNGTAISGAVVKSGNVNVTTDVNGVFILNNISANQKLGCVIVEKAGYFKCVRSFVPKTGGNELQIQLLAKSIDGTINSSTGGTVSIQNGSVTLPANGVTLNNSAYTGNVNVAIKHFDPTSANFNDAMPGSLVGVENNTVSSLTSYGMLGVELTDNNGHLLQIASGKTATLKFKVPTSLQASAPASIDLWSLDETKGYWKKEGVANLVNNEYVGQVSHFSFWNCDKPNSFVYINGKILNNQTQQPLQNATVTITSVAFGSASDQTNSQGMYNGLVPNGENLTISVSLSCNGGGSGIVYTATLPALSSNTSISDISVSLPNQTLLSGTVVGCNNQPLNNSYLIIDNKIVYTNNGYFNYTACGSSLNVACYGTNPWVSGQVQNVTLTGGNQNIGNIIVCNPSGGTVTDIDGNIYQTVIIGNQEWMQENLKTTHYRNGAIIPYLADSVLWQNNNAGACTDVNGNSSNTSVYGKLYNFYAVADPRGLCPIGWHVPENSEWIDLVKTLDVDVDSISGIPSLSAGGGMKEIGLTHWQSPNLGATNISGFTGLPGGMRYGLGTYVFFGTNGYWWSSSDFYYPDIFGITLYHNDSTVTNFMGFGLEDGLSVRCVKD